jgi:putative DNA primase/helicase
MLPCRALQKGQEGETMSPSTHGPTQSPQTNTNSKTNVSAVYNGLKRIANKYINVAPHDIRPIVSKIIEELEVNLDDILPTISLNNAEVEIPPDLNSLNYAVETLLYRSGYAKEAGSRLAYVISILVKVLHEYIENKRGNSVIAIEIKHVTDREKLAFEIANQILNEHIIKTFYVTSSDKEVELGIHCYDGLVYRPCEKKIISEIARMVRTNENLARKTTRWVVNEALFRIRSETLTPLHYEPMVIAFENVLFDWRKFKRTLSLRKSVIIPNPDIIVFHRIPHKLPTDKLYNYLEGLLKYNEINVNIEKLAKNLCPKTLRAFKSWVGDRWILLFEIIGAILIPEPIKKAFLLIDVSNKVGDTGKSTFIRYLQRLIGKENYTSVSLQELTDPQYRFRASRIYRKLVNFYPDLPDRAVRNVGNFKVVTGEDVITIEKKHREPFEWLPYTKHIFSANEPPPVFNADRAFWNRWIVIEFIGNFEEKIKGFEETLLDEAPYALLVGIMAFKEVIANGWKFSFEDTPEDAKRKWMARSDSVYAFFTAMLELGMLKEDPKGVVKTSELYNMYARWCNENGVEPIDHRVFPNHIRKVLGYQVKRKSDGTYIIGLRMVSRTL